MSGNRTGYDLSFMSTIDLVLILHDLKTHPYQMDKEFLDAISTELDKRYKLKRINEGMTWTIEYGPKASSNGVVEKNKK